MKGTLSASISAGGSKIGIADPAIAVFECVNATRAGQAPTSGVRRRPSPSLLQWPIPAIQVLLPCTGQLQPEHILKAFEEGCDAVCVIACEEDNCHCLEGSKRVRRRGDYVRRLLDEMGLGGNRLMLFNLPGSARQDMVLGLDETADAQPAQDLSSQVQAIVREAMCALQTLSPNPLRKNRPAAEPVEENYITNQEEESD